MDKKQLVLVFGFANGVSFATNPDLADVRDSYSSSIDLRKKAAFNSSTPEKRGKELASLSPEKYNDLVTSLSLSPEKKQSLDQEIKSYLTTAQRDAILRNIAIEDHVKNYWANLYVDFRKNTSAALVEPEDYLNNKLNYSLILFDLIAEKYRQFAEVNPVIVPYEDAIFAYLLKIYNFAKDQDRYLGISHMVNFYEFFRLMTCGKAPFDIFIHMINFREIAHWAAVFDIYNLNDRTKRFSNYAKTLSQEKAEQFLNFHGYDKSNQSDFHRNNFNYLNSCCVKTGLSCIVSEVQTLFLQFVTQSA